ncbi:hypothetical protein Dimus_016907 [Dionaea muscipula]
MGALFHHLLCHEPFATRLPPPPHRLHPKTHLPLPILAPILNFSETNGQSLTTRSKISSLRGKSRDPDEPIFKDDEGESVVDAMDDGYLNNLSLEYDSVWDTKPSWCQPWTITLTGVLVVAFSWIIMHSFVLSSVVLILICGWWYIFLYSYPKAYSEMIADRRRKVNDGVEDTFGLRRIQ